MQVEVYGDVVFLINFAMDFFILAVTGRLCGEKVRLWRIAVAAGLASFIYCVLLFAAPVWTQNLATAFVLIAVSVCGAFLPARARRLARLSLVAFAVAFAVGGGIAALFFMLGDFGKIPKYFSIQTLIAGTIVSYIALKVMRRIFEKNKLQKRLYCQITISLQDSRAELCALVDTGNALTDPITNTPVIVAQYSAVKTCLPTGIRKLYDENKQDDLAAILANTENTPFAGRIRLIPFKSVGHESGVLLGFRPDKIELVNNNKVYEKKAVIGICSLKLSENGEYEALINPALL